VNLKLIMILISILGFLGAGTAIFMKGKAYCENKVKAAVIEAQEAARVKTDQLTTKHLKSTQKLTDRVNNLLGELNVPDNPVCDSPDNTIRVLDAIRGVSQASGVDVRADAEFRSYLSQRDAFRQWGEDAKAYRLCRERVAAFIEWHDS